MVVSEYEVKDGAKHTQSSSICKYVKFALSTVYFDYGRHTFRLLAQPQKAEMLIFDIYAPSVTAMAWLAGILICVPVLSAVGKKLRGHRYEVVNPSPSWDIFNLTSMVDFLRYGQQRVAEGFEKFSGRPFILNTDVQPRIILSPDYIDPVNATPGLDFIQFVKREFLSHLPSFRFFDPPGHLVEDMVRVKLTQNLSKFTVPLSEETTLALDEIWDSPIEWQEHVVKEDVLLLISRLSAIVFTGGELAHNKEWQRITIDVTVNGFLGVLECRSFPKPLQHLASLFMPHAIKARKNLRRGQKLIGEVISRRTREKRDAALNNKPPSQYNDAIAWIENLISTNKYPEVDPAQVQMSLAMAAIHTSSDLMTQTIYNICERPQLVQPLRQEIISVIGSQGWTKQAMAELRLLDSLLKETQRLATAGVLVMNRLAIADVELPGNVSIRKGELMAITTHLMKDPHVYENPLELDAFRFARRREDPKLANKSHFVSTSIDHTGFSHGKHACPGRFFAANEIKIALSHILLKYDMELVDSESPPMTRFGTTAVSNSTAKIRIKRRQVEFAL